MAKALQKATRMKNKLPSISDVKLRAVAGGYHGWWAADRGYGYWAPPYREAAFAEHHPWAFARMESRWGF